MTVYSPDCWVITKIHSPQETTYRVLAGWYGGYLGSDSWKMNSGITKMTRDGDVYVFDGYSGSQYRCHKDTERMSGYTSSIYQSFKGQETDDLKIDIIDVEDFEKEF